MANPAGRQVANFHTWKCDGRQWRWVTMKTKLNATSTCLSHAIQSRVIMTSQRKNEALISETSCNVACSGNPLWSKLKFLISFLAGHLKGAILLITLLQWRHSDCLRSFDRGFLRGFWCLWELWFVVFCLRSKNKLKLLKTGW